MIHKLKLMYKVVLTSVKLLGIQIDNKLLFHDHVSNVCKKAAMQINVMKRLGRYLDFNGRLQIYDSLFLSNFNYCPLVYNSTYAKNDDKIETLNKRMLRVVCNDRMSAYSVLLTRVNRPMMYYNRKKALAELVFKVLHGQSPPVPQELFIKQITMHDLRDNDMLVQRRFQTIKHGFKSIVYQGTIMLLQRIATWNTDFFKQLLPVFLFAITI